MKKKDHNIFLIERLPPRSSKSVLQSPLSSVVSIVEKLENEITLSDDESIIFTEKKVVKPKSKRIKKVYSKPASQYSVISSPGPDPNCTYNLRDRRSLKAPWTLQLIHDHKGKLKYK